MAFPLDAGVCVDVSDCIELIPHMQPSQQASAIEKSVTHLLVATKQLLETLTQWSRGTATETDVSDVYVRLGYEFNIACRAFSQVGIDTSDLGPVPDTLRAILEETLSQEASQQSLDRFLPRIRDIIINLLHGLKRKQTKLRQRTSRDGETSTRRTGSLASSHSQLSDDANVSRDSQQPPRREGSQNAGDGQTLHYSRSSAGTISPQRQDSTGANEPRRAGSSGRTPQHYPPPSAPPTQMPPALPPYPPENSIPGPIPPPTVMEPPKPASREPNAPRPPPKQNDALAALQQKGELERRASRRFSSYQIRKELGTSSAGVPMIPPAQRSPIPNRGRDIRESMNAVKSRGSQQLRRSRSRHEPSRPDSPDHKPEPVTSIRNSLRDTNNDAHTPSSAPPAVNQPPLDSPSIKTPDDKYANGPGYPSISETGMRAAVGGPVNENFTIPEIPEPSEVFKGTEQAPTPALIELEKPAPTSEVRTDVGIRQSIVAEPLVLFLQYKKQVKKLVLAGGFEECTLPRLQLAFMETFSLQASGELPEIYIQDPESGVRYELEDLNDVKNRSVLALQFDDVAEVKGHFDDKMKDVRDLLVDLTDAVSKQSVSIQQVSNKQQDTAKDIARFSNAAPAATARPAIPNGIVKGVKGSPSQLNEVEALRRELAVLRQTHSNLVSSMEKEMADVKAKATAVKEAANNVSASGSDGDRAYVDNGKKTLSTESEALITRTDNLQDKVEYMRKDVTRFARPRMEDLEQASKEITDLTQSLKKLREFLKRESPIWKKIGEKQLQAVMDDQQELKIQNELISDLEDDLEKTKETFALVEQATKQQGTRSTSRQLKQGDVAPQAAKDQMLGLVKALQPNHENRVAALEQVEQKRLKQIEQGWQDAFKEELGGYVADSKLRKTGGVEEVERVRLRREEEARRAFHETMLQRQREREEQEAAEMEDEDEEDELGEANDGPPRLEVPGLDDDDGTVSPEPEFVEAQEAPIGHANGVA